MSSETEGWLPDFAFIFLAGGCLANQVAECCVEVWTASDAAASAASAVPTVASATSALLASSAASHWQSCFGQRPVAQLVWHQ